MDEISTPSTAKTPGYDRRIAIRIKPTKNGRMRATYWSMPTMRWLPIGLDTAEMLLAQDQAERA